MVEVPTHLKVRVRECEVLICEVNGCPIVRAKGTTTLDAIRRMRRLVEHLITERKERV